MPTYTVHSLAGFLHAEQKAAIAKEITQTHSAVTGANTFFAQVMFADCREGDWYLGGVPLSGKQVYLSGDIRAGRPPELKNKLLLALRDVVVKTAGIQNHEVWAYLIELPPSNMVEYGHVLPEAGQEGLWLANLPAEDRRRLEELGS